jgi:serine/threonine protein kinase
MSFITNHLSEKQNTWNEWNRCSVLLDKDPPTIVVGLRFKYEILSEINRNGHQKCTPRSHSFCGRVLECPEETFVFIKFASADSIDTEWTATAKIPHSPHLHRPFDRSPPRPISISSFDSVPDQFHFIVSKLIDGDDLLNMLIKASYKLPLDFLKVVFHQTINALSLLQTNGIVHGDIKPENLMWDKTEQLVKIIDFEYSVNVGECQEGGTKNYQAPEATYPIPAHCSRDIYSFGVSFLTLWCGEQLLFIEDELINWPNNLDQDLETLLLTMIRWNPEDRPTPKIICQLLDNVCD